MMTMTAAQALSKLNLMKEEAARLEKKIKYKYSRIARSVNGAMVLEEGEINNYHYTIDQLTAVYQSILSYEEMIEDYNATVLIDHPRLGEVSLAKAIRSLEQTERLIEVLENDNPIHQEIASGVGIINYDNIDPEWTQSYLEELRFELEELGSKIDWAQQQDMEEE